MSLSSRNRKSTENIRLVTEGQIYDYIFHSQAVLMTWKNRRKMDLWFLSKAGGCESWILKMGLQYKVQELDDDCHITL